MSAEPGRLARHHARHQVLTARLAWTSPQITAVGAIHALL